MRRGAVKCPACGLSIVAERTGRGEALPRARGALWIVGGRCPSPACAAELYAWTDTPDRPPLFLTHAAGLRRMRLRSALDEMATALPSAALVLAIVISAMWAALRGIAEARSPAVLALVVGGPAMILAAACGFVGFAIACHRDEHHAIDGEAASTGLRLVPLPRSYRSI
jgi:hypothetical protein